MLVAILITNSCTIGTKHTIVQGYVKTYGSSTTHAGIEIELNEEGVGVTLLDKTTTNADGWYQLEGDFDVSKTHYLYLNDNPPKHSHVNNQGYNHLQVKTGGVQRFDINIHPYTWINIHFKNINPCDRNDIIGFYGSLGGSERIYGAGVDTHFLWRTTGNKEVLFSYSLAKCGQDGGSFIDTIGYVAAFDTVNFQVLY
jgi:hypothetical protein